MAQAPEEPLSKDVSPFASLYTAIREATRARKQESLSEEARFLSKILIPAGMGTDFPVPQSLEDLETAALRAAPQQAQKIHEAFERHKRKKEVAGQIAAFVEQIMSEDPPGDTVENNGKEDE